MEPLNHDIEDRIDIDLDAAICQDPISESLLVLDLHMDPFLLEVGIRSLFGKGLDLRHVAEPFLASEVLLVDFCQAGVATTDPTTRGHTVGFVLELLGVHLVEILENQVLDEVGVDFSDTVDRVGADDTL